MLLVLCLFVIVLLIGSLEILAMRGNFWPPEQEEYVIIEETYVPPGCDDDGNPKTGQGQKMSVHYTGSIAETSKSGDLGFVFDTSKKRNKPFVFTLGIGQVIKGWDQGLLNMCVGEIRTLTIPPTLGYGDRGAGEAIPPGATLKFVVEVVDIPNANKSPADDDEQRNIFDECDADADGILTRDEIAAWFIVNSPHGKGPSKQDLDSIFIKDDRNQDGIIDWDEFSGPKGKTRVTNKNIKKKKSKDNSEL